MACVTTIINGVGLAHGVGTIINGVGLAHAGNLHRQFWRWRGLRVRRTWDFGGLRASPHLDRGFRALGIQNI